MRIKIKKLNPDQSQSRLSLENDAIAALSMMIAGTPPKSEKEDDIKASRSESHNNLLHCYSNDDVIDTLTQIYNELWQLTKTAEKILPAPITRLDLENEIGIVEMEFKELHRMMSTHEKDNIAVELSSQAVPTGTIKSPQDNQTHKCLKTEHGVADRYGVEKRKFIAIESHLSCLSTLTVFLPPKLD